MTEGKIKYDKYTALRMNLIDNDSDSEGDTN